MFSFLYCFRILLIAIFSGLGLSLTAFDVFFGNQRVLQFGNQRVVYVDIKNARTVEDITGNINRQVAGTDLVDLRVGFAADIPPAARTAILTEALRDACAWRIFYLDCSGNRLIKPPVLTGLINVHFLDLHGNNLVEAPELTGLANLAHLDLHGNNLVAAPILTGLINLRFLNLSSNQLRLSPVLSGLANLKCVFLQTNRLVQPPVLTGLTQLEALWLHDNDFNRLLLAMRFRVEPVVVPLALADTLNLNFGYPFLPIPYQIEQSGVNGGPETLVDITNPGVDRARPRFLTRRSFDLLPEPKLNPFTRLPIPQTMNLVDSWRYWRDQGMHPEDFDSKLKEAEPVALQENVYTVTPVVARAFMQERAIDETRIKAVLSRFKGDEINVTALLDLMHMPELEELDCTVSDEHAALYAFAQVSEDLCNASCTIS